MLQPSSPFSVVVLTCVSSGLCCWVHPYYYTSPVLVLGFTMNLLCEIMFILLLSWILSLCIFLFWIAEAVLPSAVACLFSVELMFILCLFFLFFFLRSPVIWFIMFTAVNFHLVFVFSSFDPPPLLRCLLRLGAALWLWFWGVVASSWIPPTLLLAPPSSCDACPLIFAALPSVPRPPLSLRGVSSPGHLLVLLWCSGDDSCCLLVFFYTTLPLHTPKPRPTTRWPIPLLPP